MLMTMMMMLKWTVTFKLCPVATEGPFVCLGNIPITPMKDGPTDLCCPSSDPVISITNRYLSGPAAFNPTLQFFSFGDELLCSCFSLLAGIMPDTGILLL